MQKPTGGIVVSITGGSEVGKLSTSKAVLEIIPNSFFIKSKTTRSYPPEDERRTIYEHINDVAFSGLRIANMLAFWALHEGLGSPKRFGVETEVIDNILRPPVGTMGMIGITMLNIASVVGLREYLKQQDALKSHLPIFLCAPEPEVLKRRLLRKQVPKEEIGKRLGATARLEQEARLKTNIPYVFIQNDPDAKVVAGRILAQITAHRKAHHV